MNWLKKLAAAQCSVLWVATVGLAGAAFYYDHTADWATVCNAQHKDRARVVREAEATRAELAAAEQALLLARQTLKIREAGWRAESRDIARDDRSWEKAIARMTAGAGAGTEVAPLPAKCD